MKLFHASKHKFDIIERRQAQHPEADEFDVPGGELQNKIYLTPDLGFALAMAAGPDGMTSLSDDRISSVQGLTLHTSEAFFLISWLKRMFMRHFVLLSI
jgi:hypothetical protein